MNILITGGTGSLGRALTGYLIKMDKAFGTDKAGLKRLVIFSRDEFKQSEMSKEFTDRRVRFFLGDVRDRDRLKEAFHGVDLVIHAAALKRVDSISYNPSEVVKTNIYGTMNVIQAAVSEGVGKVMVVSSDKAVAPLNIYGCSKMVAEQYAVTSNSFAYPQGTRVSAVRYGNVIGSRGSVVGIFKDASSKGQVIPITDPACTRFLITMDQAVSFVLDSVEMMRGGEIFVPYLPAANILTIMRAAVGHMAKWERVGLRDGGEKQHEVLMTSNEIERAVVVKHGFLIPPQYHPWDASLKFEGFEGKKLEFSEYSSRNGVLSVEQVGSLINETSSRF